MSQQQPMTIFEAKVIHYVMLDTALMYKNSYYQQELNLIMSEYKDLPLHDRKKKLEGIKTKYKRSGQMIFQLNNEVKKFFDGLPEEGKTMFAQLRQAHIVIMNNLMTASKGGKNTTHMMQLFEMFNEGKLDHIQFTEPVPANQADLFTEKGTEKQEE